jgi:hypothetical protein
MRAKDLIMPITFKSQATGDLIMLQATAEALLELIGKSASQPGILEVADMPAALLALRAAPVEQPPDDAELKAFGDQPVSLHQRAVPFVRLIEQAQAGGKPVVWGV